MAGMVTERADLMFDPNDVGPDCVVRCRISNGPRNADRAFNPQIGDAVILIDDDAQMLRGRVTQRDGDRVWVQVNLSQPLSQTA